MNRILVIGINGAGKSTIARRLGKKLNIKVFHLDKYYWKKNWDKPEKKQWRKTVKKLIQKPSWIIDGTYPSTLNLRAQKADTIIYLEAPKLVVLFRIIKRFFIYSHKSKIFDRPKGLKERLSWQLIKKVITYDKQKILQKLHQHKDKNIIVLQSEKAITQFMTKHNK